LCSALRAPHKQRRTDQPRGYPSEKCEKVWTLPPTAIRSDNGGEFVGGAVRAILCAAGVEALAVEAGCPWENGVVESLNSIVRDTLLNTDVFATVRAARDVATAWRLEYNHRRGHGALGYQTPAAFAACCPSATDSAALRPPPPGSRQDQNVMVLS